MPLQHTLPVSCCAKGVALSARLCVQNSTQHHNLTERSGERKASRGPSYANCRAEPTMDVALLSFTVYNLAANQRCYGFVDRFRSYDGIEAFSYCSSSAERGCLSPSLTHFPWPQLRPKDKQSLTIYSPPVGDSSLKSPQACSTLLET